jgi:hypothetical protein
LHCFGGRLAIRRWAEVIVSVTKRHSRVYFESTLPALFESGPAFPGIALA